MRTSKNQDFEESFEMVDASTDETSFAAQPLYDPPCGDEVLVTDDPDPQQSSAVTDEPAMGEEELQKVRDELNRLNTEHGARFRRIERCLTRLESLSEISGERSQSVSDSALRRLIAIQMEIQRTIERELPWAWRHMILVLLFNLIVRLTFDHIAEARLRLQWSLISPTLDVLLMACVPIFIYVYRKNISTDFVFLQKKLGRDFRVRRAATELLCFVCGLSGVYTLCFCATVIDSTMKSYMFSVALLGPIAVGLMEGVLIAYAHARLKRVSSLYVKLAAGEINYRCLNRVWGAYDE